MLLLSDGWVFAYLFSSMIIIVQFVVNCNFMYSDVFLGFICLLLCLL